MKLFTIGCSFTEGQGLKNQKTECYPHLLSKILDIEYFNFGACGMSNDYIFRKIFELINSNTITKDDILIIQWTHFIRKELSFVKDDREWFHSIPNSFHVYSDKIIHKNESVQNNYIDEDLDSEKKYIESNNKKKLEDYTLHFLNTNYQKNTTKNYINALYTYLEHFGYKHLHFFGWDNCIIHSIFDEKENFIKETFGGFTNTINNEHPNKRGHKIWADFLNQKLKEFKFINPFEKQLDTYQKNLAKLKVEIEEEVPMLFKNRMERLKIEFEREINNSNKKLQKEKEKELEERLQKIKLQREKEIDNTLKAKKIELDKIEKQLKDSIDKSKKTKTLI